MFQTRLDLNDFGVSLFSAWSAEHPSDPVAVTNMPLHYPDMTERTAERPARLRWPGELDWCLLAARIALAVCFFVVRAAGQVPSSPGTATCGERVRSTYLLGPDDQLDVSVSEFSELTDKRVRVDGDGDIQVPLVGRVHVSGLTAQQTEQELSRLLSTYIRRPQVAVSVEEVRSQPVSILGAVNSPGVHQVQGHKTLVEMLALAGGIRPDAGYSVRITRELEWGCIPLPNARLDPSGRFSVAEVKLKEIMEAKNPEEDVPIFPHDIISVPKAEMVYVIGDVKRSGGFVLGEHQSISVLQALSLAEGLNGTADARHARILRLKGNAGEREETAVDVKDILRGKKSDVALEGDDILFVPGSTGKKATLRGIEAAIQTGTGVLIWHAP